jgi:ribosome maturation protein SDO1
MGNILEISQVLVIDTIFSDASKGQRTSEEKLQKTFQTIDPLKIAETILKQGELPLTTAQRRMLVNEKRKQIINFISKNCLDPRTGYSHPPLRIEQAMNQLRLVIDPFKSGEEQARVIINELRPIIPIKFEQIRIAIKISSEHVARTVGVVKDLSTIKQEEWQADGSWIAVIEMPAGLHSSFLDRIGKTTRGQYQIKILK